MTTNNYLSSNLPYIVSTLVEVRKHLPTLVIGGIGCPLQHTPKIYTKGQDINALEESLSITTGRCDLAIATHARKMHKNLFVVVHPEVLDND
jgi:hypothetical protein